MKMTVKVSNIGRLCIYYFGIMPRRLIELLAGLKRNVLLNVIKKNFF